MLIRQVIDLGEGRKYSRNKHIPFAPFPGLLIGGLEVQSVAVGLPGWKQDEIEVTMKPTPNATELDADGWKRGPRVG